MGLYKDKDVKEINSNRPNVNEENATIIITNKALFTKVISKLKKINMQKKSILNKFLPKIYIIKYFCSFFLYIFLDWVYVSCFVFLFNKFLV